MSDTEKMNVPKVIELMQKAISLQLRSAALYTWAAGAATGIQFQAIALAAGAEKVVAVATSAVRESENAAELIQLSGGLPSHLHQIVRCRRVPLRHGTRHHVRVPGSRHA